MLSGKLVLHDVDDGEAFARQVIQRTASKHCLSWSEYKRDDLLAACIAHLWELSLRYQPEIGTFSGYARRFLGFYVIDWIRYEEGRTKFKFGPDAQHIRLEFRQGGGLYERPRRETISYDEPGLDEALGSRGLDPHESADSLDFAGAVIRGAGPGARAATEEDREDACGPENGARRAA